MPPRNRPQFRQRQALALAIAEDRAGQEVLRATERAEHGKKCVRARKEAEDPIVAYDLIHIFSLNGEPKATVLTGDITVAKQAVYDLDGPYTTKDFNIRSVRRSEMRARKALKVK